MTFLAMLRRRVPRCGSVFLLTAAFTLAAGGDVLGQHACPHHDVAPASAAHRDAPTAPDSDANHDNGPAADHSGHGHHDTAAVGPATHGEPGEHAPCNCIEDCQGSTAPLPPSGYSSAIVAAQAWYIAHVVSADGLVVRLLPYVLPFANGPPTHG